MVSKITLKTVEAPFALFPTLKTLLTGKANALSGRNIIFTEEKFSLMTERSVCAAFGGSFNTDVYSFGTFLRRKNQELSMLSKEGSAMVVKRVLENVDLKCFKASKKGLAPMLFELIMQLKSAKIGVSDIREAVLKCDGILKNKLTDIAAVYESYEEFMKERSLSDQSGALAFLPDFIEKEEGIETADVYLVGFTSFTAQAKTIIETLAKTAKSITAVLVGGDNEYLYTNEAIKAIYSTAKKLGLKIECEELKSDLAFPARIIKDNIFKPTGYSGKKINTDNVFIIRADTIRDEVTAVAETIKKKVLYEGKRYRDFTIAVPDGEAYDSDIEEVFAELEIPFFTDKKRGIICHPLTRLIISYVEAWRKNFDKNSLRSFIKNPIVSGDIDFIDEFCNYLDKYNIERKKFFVPFTFAPDNNKTEDFESFRQTLNGYFEKFDVLKLLEKTDAEKKCEEFSESLKSVGDSETGEISGRTYSYITSLLSQMDMILGGSFLSYGEYKSVFLSGVLALKASVIPQYTDAVFIGGYKETALAKASGLFLMGLTDEVPSIKSDVALLSDSDINRLDNVQVLIEPKIKVVNEREKESVGLSLLAFGDEIYLSYPLVLKDGKACKRSEIVDALTETFTVKQITGNDGYLTEKQGLNTFASDCGRYVYGESTDFIGAAAYYFACGENSACQKIAESSGKTIKERLEHLSAIRNGAVSPTAIEEFYTCPYKAFASRYLRITDKKSGELDTATSGSFVHEAMKNFALKAGDITDEESFKKVFGEIADGLKKEEDYARFFADDKNAFYADGLIAETEKFCRKMFDLFNRSAFKPQKDRLEVKFGEGKPLPPIKLLNGKVRLEGVIDRVDVCGEHCRIIDYKTGSTHGENKYLLSGTKLQLYLYAAVMKEKKIAGLYYFPVSDAYRSFGAKEIKAVGKTLNDAEIIRLQEGADSAASFLGIFDDASEKGLASEEEMQGCIDYALKMSERAAEEMANGVILASPFENACDFCPYYGMCDGTFAKKRTAKEVKNEYFVSAAKNGEEFADKTNRIEPTNSSEAECGEQIEEKDSEKGKARD